MGTPATAHGTIVFESPLHASEAFELIEKWVTKALSGNLPEEENGDYNIYNLELDRGKRFIVFKADSGRYQNLEWQLQNLLNFCKRLKGIETFEAPIMVLSDDGIFWENIEEDEEA
jgi:hypothetical protein